MMTVLIPSLLVLCLLATIAVLGIAYALRRKASGSGAGGIVAFARIAAWIGLGTIAISVGIVVVTAIMNDQMTVQVPVEPFWPEYPNVSEVTPDRGGAVHAEITSVTVTASALGAATRSFLVAGSLVSGFASIAVLAAVITLCNKLLAGKPFSDSLLRGGRLAAGALAFGTLIGQTLTGIGTYRAGEETLRVDGYALTGDQIFDSSPWPEPAFSINYEFAPLFMALAILAVVELVNAGMKMARQNDELRAQTDGLI